jgi:hypothetical protein
VARVVTAVPGRIVVLGLGVVGAAAGDVVAVALALGVAVVERRAVAELDVASAATAVVAGVVDDEWSAGSAFAGTQAAMVRTTSNDPAAAGQWRSGWRIMRRDRNFHSATPQR